MHIIDIELVTQNCGGDPAVVLELAVMFLDESARQMRAIQEALSSGNSEDMEFAAHRLRGGLSIFAVESAMQAAAAVELIGSSRQTEEAPEAVARLGDELVQIANDMRELILTEAKTVSIN
jgi:HPt (histidine-containing phosphotransfer) domain-containing protein